jgi:lysylphosphatidylglycerol synthetase-like protein (DUF2156 family)
MRGYRPTNDGGIQCGICSSQGVAPMRFFLFLIICAAALWIGDMFLYHGRYRNELWRDVQIEAQKINYDVRRAVGL